MIIVGALRVREDSATGPQKLGRYFPISFSSSTTTCVHPSAILIVMTLRGRRDIAS
jgi:hypothetical protein